MQENNKKNAPETEIIYVITNPAMPGLVKIGRTNNLPRRLAQHYNSAVPYRFVVNHAVEVAKDRQVESLLHELFRAERIPRREFFKMPPERAVDALRFALRLVEGTVVDENYKVGDGKDSDDTPVDDGKDIAEDAKVRNKRRERRPNFRFKDLGIRVGAVLTFSGDAEVKAIVVDDVKNTIEYKGKPTSVSKAATEALGGKTYDVNGAKYWEYEGETLDARRARKQEEEADENEDDS